jgi:CheY-like chemotaxis protein
MPLGFKVLEARDAHHCLELVQRTAPDLFLLDISMPGMDGLTLADRLRKTGHKVPILMLSADVQEQRRQPAGEAVYDDYLVKPISNQLLLERVGHYLQLEWIRTAAIVAPPVSVPVTPVPPNDLTASSLPDHPLIRELRGSAEIGFRRGVREALEQIEREQLVSRTVLAELQTLADSMQFAQLAEYLEQTS